MKMIAMLLGVHSNEDDFNVVGGSFQMKMISMLLGVHSNEDDFNVVGSSFQ